MKKRLTKKEALSYLFSKCKELKEEMLETDWGCGCGFDHFSFDGGDKKQPVRAYFWEDRVTYGGEHLGAEHYTELVCYAGIQISAREMKTEKGINKAMARLKKKLEVKLGQGVGMAEDVRDKVRACIDFTLANAGLSTGEFRELQKIRQLYFS